jgi:hypothetical protein
MGAGDNETRTLITQTYQRADAFLFGRRTYELFAGSWGEIAEMRAHPMGAGRGAAGVRERCSPTPTTRACMPSRSAAPDSSKGTSPRR